jgi:hypothetical protein
MKILTRHVHQLFVRQLTLKPVEHVTGWFSLPTVFALEVGSQLLLFLFLGRDVRLYLGTDFVDVVR